MLTKFRTIVIVLVIRDLNHCPNFGLSLYCLPFKGKTIDLKLGNPTQFPEAIIPLLQISLPVVSYEVI